MIRQTLIVVLCVSTPALAQSGAAVTHHLAWQEVETTTGLPVANPNGVLEPGESALISISMSFSPPVGAFYNGNPEWPVRALRSSFFNFFAGVEGTWSNRQLAPGWDAFGPIGHVNPLGNPSANRKAIHSIMPFQLPDNPDTSNPVQNVFQTLWTPDHYAFRPVHFSLWSMGSLGAALWLVEDPTVPQGYSYASVTGVTGMMSIPMNIPAPGPAFTILAAMLLAARRKR